MKVQKFGYKIIKTEDLSKLDKYKDHRRLRVYFHKGTKCVNPKCERKGEILTHGIDKFGNLHIDLCTSDFYPITVDHILPKSLGGSDDLENLQPMCLGCNSNKGNGKKNKSEKQVSSTPKFKEKFKNYHIQVGDIVFKKRDNVLLGKVLEIKENPYHPKNDLSVTIEGKDPKSLYNRKSLYTEGIEI